MGLLDSFTTDPDQQSAIAQGLLSGGFSMLANSQGIGYKPSLAAVIGQGGTQGLQTYNTQRALQARLKEEAQQHELRQMQIDATANAIKKQRALEDAARAAYRSPAQVAMANGQGPTQENAEALQVARPSFDQGAYADSVMQIDPERGMQLMQQAQAQAQRNAFRASLPAELRQQFDIAPEKFIDKRVFGDPKIEDSGGAKMMLDPMTRQWVKAFDKTMTPGEVATNAVQRGNLDLSRQKFQWEKNNPNPGSDGLVDPSRVENMAQMVAWYKMQPLGQMALRTPEGRAVMARVTEINPDFNAQNYGSQGAALKAFTSGKKGDAVRSFNVGLAHLESLQQLSDAMANGNTQALNKVANYYAEQTGKPAPTNFNAAKKIVSDEIVKAIVGAGGALADREAAAKTIDAASSPQQLSGVINTYKDLMRGQLGGLRQQYETATGRKDFDSYLSPSALVQSHGTSTPIDGAAGAEPQPQRQRVTQVGKAAPFGERHLVISGKTYQILGANPDGSVRIMDPATGKTGTYKE